MDNSDFEYLTISGEWETQTDWMRQYHTDHLFWRPGNEPSFLSYKPPLPDKGGKYHTYLYIPRKRWKGKNFKQLAEDVKIEIKASNSISVRTYNFEEYSYDWLDLGEYLLEPGDYVRIYAEKNEYPVIADALLLVPLEN